MTYQFNTQINIFCYFAPLNTKYLDILRSNEFRIATNFDCKAVSMCINNKNMK